MDYFPHAKLAVKTVKRCKVGAVLSSEAIERWIPQYVGSELPSAGQKKMVSEREKSVAMPLAHLLEQSAAFWMSHGIAGRVSPMAVMRHNMLLVRIASQGSTAVAVQYERTLIQHIRNLKGEPDMNMLLGDKVDAVETAVHIHFSRVAKQKEPPPLSRNMHYGNTGGLMKVKHEEEGQASSAGRGQEQRFTQTNAGRNLLQAGSRRSCASITIRPPGRLACTATSAATSTSTRTSQKTRIGSRRLAKQRVGSDCARRGDR